MDYNNFLKHSKILSVGSYLPEKVFTNNDLEKFVDTNDSWIVERTGIKKRHIAEQNQLSSDMAKEASLQAIKRASIISEDIDLIIVATTTPDKTFPSTAAKLQSLIGAKNAFAFDLQAVCAGFIYAISVADNYIKSGHVKTALVVGVDKMSALLDWQDRSTCVLFGDGAGAVIIQAQDKNESMIIGTKLYCDGSFENILYTSGGVSSTGSSGTVQMQGKEVFKNAVEKMSSACKEICDIHNISINNIDHFIPHQANIRIMEGVAKKLSFPLEKVIATVDHHANTSAASIPLALEEAVSADKIQRGQTILLTAFGAGLTWGASIIKW